MTDVLAPKVETRLYLVEYSKSAFVMVEVKVDGVPIGSLLVASDTTLASPGSKGYAAFQLRVDVMKRFLKGEITLDTLREELY